ncbi:hypothetical protein N7466_007948 [Penicillium verhagenii]|uniref:uncharacterized protein n=1 Tax=Penicillium verhagenii TaxID=1562060 RepID=UPI00254569BB|nr:uncharacterized protein N7466_007948 [Penicillium verhagenii]KAJ5928992.1 hypothetical protein N7466_007948 [Penicillium verhagenii]
MPFWNQHPLQPDLIKEMDAEEARLAKSGNVHALQKYRYDNHFCPLWPRKYIDDSPKLLDVEQELREVIQEEISIRQRTHSSSGEANISKERLHGICTKDLLRIVLAGKAVVLGVVAAVSIAMLIKPASLELDIVPFNVDVAKEREAPR